jgi:hypothetical protein
MRRLLKIAIPLVIIVILFCCQNNKSKLKETIVSWQNKFIYLPKTLKLVNGNNKRSSYLIFNNKPNLIVYYDNTGCTECKLRLNDWNDIFKEVADSLYNVSIVFIVQPPRENTSDLKQIFKDYRFDHPVYSDSLNRFVDINKILNDSKLNVFLLDSKNRITLIGSPIQNPKMWKLYKDYLTNRIITNRSSEVIQNSKSINMSFKSINVGKVQVHSNKKISFLIKNNDKKPLVISHVRSSCGCLITEFNKEPISIGKTGKINLILKLNSEGYFNKTADVVCNISQKSIKLRIQGYGISNSHLYKN